MLSFSSDTLRNSTRCFFLIHCFVFFIDCVATSCVPSRLRARVVSFSFISPFHIYVLRPYKWQGARHQLQLAWLFYTSPPALFFARARRYEASRLSSVIYALLSLGVRCMWKPEFAPYCCVYTCICCCTLPCVPVQTSSIFLVLLLKHLSRVLSTFIIQQLFMNSNGTARTHFKRIGQCKRRLKP